tara:strand:- start:5289 stop:14237 length:8949 start_codon:yes stop_codon:yes gene_type:complete
MSNNALYDLFQERERKNRRTFIEETGQGTTGNALYDFLGQAAWGFTDTGSLGLLNAADAYKEGVYGDDADTWEEMIAGDAAGDWDELSASGRAGNMIGTALGYLIPYSLVGKAVGKGVTTLGRVTGIGTKWASAKSTKELVKAAGNFPVSPGRKKVSEVLTSKKATQIIDDAYEVAEASAAIHKIESALGAEIIEQTMRSTVRSNMQKTLNIADDEILDALSTEAVKIVSRNNPKNAMQMMNIVANRAGLGPRSGYIVGAMAYDAAIGVGIATLRTAQNIAWQKAYGVEFEGMDGYKYKPDNYDLNYGKIAGNWAREALFEGLFMSILGPVQFWRGGTSGQHLSRMRKIVSKASSSYYKPLKKYSNEELRAQITAMHKISGGYLDAKLPMKWRNKPDNWWATATDDAGTAEMREYLSALRRKFIVNAPIEWTKEFGKDMFYSLPRMGVGVVAMNGMGLAHSFYNNGLSMESLRMAMGETLHEIAANVMTAMFFTRKPHSFHTDTTKPGWFNKVFQTGDVPMWTSKIQGDIVGKANKLKKIMGGLETFGMDKDKLKSISYVFGDGRMSDEANKAASNSIKRQMDATPEFKEIENVFKKYVGNEDLTGVDLVTGFNKYTSELVKNGDLTLEQATMYQDKLHIARKIIDIYEGNSGDPINIKQYTPVQAFEIVNELATIKFNGKELSTLNIDPEFKEWTRSNIIKSISEKHEIMRNYIIETYEALGIPIEAGTKLDEMVVPDIREALNFADFDAGKTFATVYQFGIDNNWIRPGTALPSEFRGMSGDQQTKASEIFNKYSERMMDSVYGPRWRDEIDLDLNILRDRSFHFTYDTALKLQQIERGYQLLTGGNEHGAPLGEARDTFVMLQNLILNKQLPSIEKPAKDVEGYGEVKDFIDKLHSVVLDLNPTVVKNSPTKLTLEQATAIKERIESVVGDLIRNPDAFRDFKNDILDRSLDKLQLHDANAGIDVKASFRTIINDAGMNYQGDGYKVVLPSVESIGNHLKAMKESGAISDEAYNSLKTHYEKVMAIAADSKYPMTFDDNLIENKEGDWYRALLKSKATGEAALDHIAFDRIGQYSEFLNNEVTKFEKQLEWLSSGMNNLDTTGREKVQKQMDIVVKEMKATMDLVKILKTALKDNDPYTLRALARKEGDIESVLNLLSQSPANSSRMEYAENVLRIAKEVQDKAQQIVLNETSAQAFIREQLRSKNIQDKDVQDNSMRITTPIFSNKYRMPMNEIDKLFEIDRSTRRSSEDLKSMTRNILGDYYELTGDIRSLQLRSDVKSLVRKIEQLSGDVLLSDDNFMNFVVKPLELKMRIEVENMPNELKPSQAQMDSDLYGITSNYFSKRVVKTLKLDLRTNKLIQSESVVGNTKERGLTGILELLDPSQNFIYLAERTGIDMDGKSIRDINTRDLAAYNSALKSGNFSIEHSKAESEFYKTDDVSKLKDVNQDHSLEGERFEIIPINESTSLVVRVDKSPGSIHRELAIQYSQGGELYKKIEALYDGDLGLDTPKHKVIRDLLQTIRGGKDDMSVVQGIKLTRLLLNMPNDVEFVVGNGDINLEHSRIKRNYKYDKLNETKNGYVPTVENRAKTAKMYQNSKSRLYNNVYDQVKDWFEADKKVKSITIKDEKTDFDRSNNEYNIFNSLDRAKVKLDEKLANGDFGDDRSGGNPDYLYNLKLIGDAQKSIVDGETFVTKEFYLASMAMIGLHPDMVRTDATGNVVGFKSGGIKPTISHSKIVTEGKGIDGSDYGQVEQWFGKTAFKYNPVMNDLMSDLGVDMLTFSSSNKKNLFKRRVGEDTTDRFANLNPVASEQLPIRWHDYVNRNTIRERVEDVITEIPLESFSLRTISKEHDPSVAANTGIHMSDKNGISEWIGLQRKITAYKDDLNTMYTDPYFRTALGQKVVSSMTETGDPSMTNSAISSILSRDGLILEPWAQRKLEENLINYYINNGSISGGVVEDGSLDVMTADYGNLDISVRSTINDRPTVQYYGEFLPSYYASQKLFKKPGSELNGVHNVLIQRIKYKAEDGNMREADAFLVDIQGEKFLQVEGRFIDEKGRLRDIDDPGFFHLEYDSNNSAAYRRAERIEKEAYEMKDQEGRLLIDENTTLASAALSLDPLGLSVGMLNVRQPRNMIGDVVISKMAIVDGKAHVDENAGNTSMMNSVDAIKPQDADFDFDKSFNYVAAPGEFWRETNKVAGYITGSSEGQDGAINRLFDPNVQTGFFAKTLPDLISGDYTNDMILAEVNVARGQFIKMHQTSTYLSNMFKSDNLLLTFDVGDIVDINQATLQVRLNNSGKYVNLVDNISDMAKRFIDMYDRLPSTASVDKIRSMQDEIWFGENGIFDIGVEERGSYGNFKKVNEYKLTDDRFKFVRDAIRARLIDPLNSYLKYNRGVQTDVAGVQTRATIEDYNRAFVNLYNKTLDISKAGKWGLDPRVNFEAGLNRAMRYFDESQNPYDVAMRELHGVHIKSSTMKEEGSFGKGYKKSDEIVDYIENGFIEGARETRLQQENRLFNIALNEYVKDESRVLRLLELAKRERSLTIEIESKKKFVKPTEENTELANLTAQLSRVKELKADMEESVSYMFGKNDEINPPKLLSNYGYGQGDFYNRSGKAVVVLDNKGKIVEVVQPNRTNRNSISKTRHKMIENGKRYQVTSGDEQQGLRILAEAFGGNPVIRDSDGKVHRMDIYELVEYLNIDYGSLQAKIRSLGAELAEKDFRSREDFAKYSIRRKATLFDALFKDIDDPVYRKALILRLLAPDVSDKIVNIRSVNQGGPKKAVFDYMYLENKLNEPTMALLTDIASGEYKPDYMLKDFANEVLNDVTIMKNIAYIASKNRHIDIELLTSRMYTEPASLDGALTTKKMISQDIFNKRESSDANERNAAKVLIEYATGKLVDPSILYKATKVMEASGIPVDRIWGKQRYLTNEDGTVREYGSQRIFINEADALRRKDLGERGGINQSTTQMMKNHWDCLLKGDS